MKTLRILSVLAVLASFTAFTSCSDSDGDDGNPDGSEDLVQGFETVQEAEALIRGAYRPYQTLSSTFTSMVDTPTELGTSYLGNEEDDVTKMVELKYNKESSYAKKTFNALYNSIGTVNDAIEQAQASTKISEADKQLVIGKAKFSRGLFYSWLTVLWGEVPLRLTTADVNNTERRSIDEVYAQVVKDLTEAAEVLPDKPTSPIDPSKGAAYALLTRIYLQWASVPLNYDEVDAIKTSRIDPTPKEWNSAYLNKVIEYADKVTELGYKLQDNFEDLFGLYNESKGPEQIFTIYHEGDGIDAQGNHQNHCAWTYPFQETTEVIHIQPIHTFKNWPDDDPRKAFSIVTEIKDPRDNSIHTYLPPVSLPAYGKGVDRSGASTLWETQLNNAVDRIEIRYAEVLLNKAEALVQLGRNTDAAAPLNQIRERGFKDKAHNIASPTLDDIQKEWEYEFVYEQRHWQNLTRWKNLIATVLTVKDFEHYDNAFSDANNPYPGHDGYKVGAFFARIHRFLVSKYNNINGHFYRFPIPYGSEGEDLGIVPQNPGYSN